MNPLEQLHALIVEADWTGVTVELDPTTTVSGAWCLDVWRTIHRDPWGNGGRAAPRCVVEWYEKMPAFLTINPHSGGEPALGYDHSRSFDDIAEAMSYVRQVLELP